MANIYNRGGKWYARFQHGGEEFRRSTGVKVIRGKGAADAKAKAQSELERMMAEIRGGESAELLFLRLNEAIGQMPENDQERKRIEFSGRIREGVTAKLSIADAWEAWKLSPKKKSPSSATVEMYRAYWGRDSVKKGGKQHKTGFTVWLKKTYPRIKFMHEVTPGVVDEYLTHLWGTGIAPRTYNGALKFLRGMFDVLSVKAGIYQNPWQGFPTKENETEGRRNLTMEELKTVCETATGDLRYWIACGLYTGLRLGDVVTLQWNEIDLKKKKIKLTPRKTRRKGKKLEVTIRPGLLGLFAELKRQQGKSAGDYLFPEAAELYLKNGATAITGQIQRHFEQCGIKTTEEPGEHRKKKIVRVGFHSLRHSFVSLCAANNVPQVVIQKLVGHGSPLMTELYSHADDDQQAAAIAMLPDFIGEE